MNKSASIDSPEENDNRGYVYKADSRESRCEYPQILEWVKPNSRVIDFGCGSGELLSLLRDEKQTTGVGIEISDSGVRVARAKGLEVIHSNADRLLPEFKESSFDYAICNVTIQMVMYPEILFQEMTRLARFQIVSFPNFAFFRNRIDLFLSGRMPRPGLYGYTWYSTGHIHQLSLQDFKDFADEANVQFLDYHSYPEPSCKLKHFMISQFPNLLSRSCLVLTRRKS